MKLFIPCLIGLLLYLCLSFSVEAQQQRPNDHQQTLLMVLDKLALQYQVNFLYEESSISGKYVPASLKSNKSNLNELLDKILKPQGLDWYGIDARNYSIFPLKQRTKTILDSSVVSQGTDHWKDSISHFTITGRVFNELHQPQIYATVSLVHLPDSIVTENTLCDTAGRYQFQVSKAGSYFVKISIIGYKTFLSNVFQLYKKDFVLEPILMELLPHTLKTVQVTATRPVIQSKSDRLVYNVENSPMAVGSSIQVLKTAPFVQVSADNAITLQGKKTMILIDDKPVPEDALENILKTLPAGNINKIELVTHPSAKYDAAYGAVINIITKKNQLEGITGSLRTDGSQGIYGNLNVGGSVTYKHKGITLFSNLSYTQGDYLYKVNSERTFSGGSQTKLLTNDWERLTRNNLYFIQFGGELKIGKNQTFGALINPNIYQFAGSWVTVNTFRNKGTPADSVLRTDALLRQKVTTSNYNINYHLAGDSGKNDLTALITYLPLTRNLRQQYPSVLKDGAGNTIRNPPFYETSNIGAIHVIISQLDYTRIFGNSWKLETGLKYQTTRSNAVVDYRQELNGSLVQIPAYSSVNKLDENISGGYFIINKNWKNEQFQIGLRAEETEAKLYGRFNRTYFDGFPSFLYQHNVNEDNNISITYRRTISRAPYYQLVPFSIFINQYTIEQGNPELRPEYDNIYSINANLHKLTVTLNYTTAKGLIGMFPVDQDVSTGVTKFSRLNLDHSSDIALYVYFPLTITSWWEMENSGTVGGYKTAQGKVLQTEYKLSSFHSDFKSSQLLKISKTIKLQVDAYYWSNYVQDLSKQSGYKNLDASLLINLWQGKAQFRIAGNQIAFKRNDFMISRIYQSYNSQDRTNTDSRRLTLGFTYNWGKTKIKVPNKKLGNEDVIRRF